MTTTDESPLTTISDLVEAHAAQWPDKRAFLCEGQSFTWSQLATQARLIAAGLAALGVTKGDRVAVLAQTSLHYVATLFGALRAGACVVPLSSSASADALSLMIGDCAPEVLFADADLLPLIEARRDRLPASLQRPGRLIGFDFSAPGWLDDAAFKQDCATALAGFVPPLLTENDWFNIIYSSGTTGAPKGILHSHGVRARQALRRNYAMSPDTINLLSTPFYSNTTLQPLFSTLAHGGQVILMRKFDAQRYLQLAQAERVTQTMLVPVQYERILAHPDFDRTDLSAFLHKQATSAKLDAELKRQIVARWPGRLVDVYGMTEGGSTCLLDATEQGDKLMTVGKPGPEHDVRIIDDNGNELPQGGIGEVVGRSPYMMLGYYNQPEKTEEMYWRDRNGLIFHRTGDIGCFDADGFVQILDRKKDVIISGGQNIYASDLEDIIKTHPAVADVAVIGVPSKQWGETPLALVVLNSTGNITAADLCSWVNERVGKTQRLSAVELRDALPRSVIGKLVKRELRAPYWQQTATT